MPLSPGMVPAMGVLQVGDGNPQVTLGRGEGLVAEQFLDMAQVGTVLQKVRGAGVSPKVRRYLLFDSRHLCIAFHDVAKGMLPEAGVLPRMVAGRDEEPERLPAGEERGPGFPQIRFQAGAGSAGKRDDTALAAFASADVNNFGLKIDIRDAERPQFGPAQSRGINGFQYGTVALAVESRDIGRTEDRHRLGGRQHILGQRIGLLCVAHVGKWRNTPAASQWACLGVEIIAFTKAILSSVAANNFRISCSSGPNVWINMI
jgi:hypothetical protein